MPQPTQEKIYPKPAARRAKNQLDFTSESFKYFEIGGVRYLWNWRWK